MEEKEIINLIKDLLKDEEEKKRFLCYLLLTKTEKEFDSLKQDLNKLLDD